MSIVLEENMLKPNLRILNNFFSNFSEARGEAIGEIVSSDMNNKIVRLTHFSMVLIKPKRMYYAQRNKINITYKGK